jgi:Ca2+-binding RTX toxin-like protein
MARVRIEWMPVQLYGLGLLGFDHLQLVFEPGEGGLSRQDDWFVMEGVRDATRDGTFLGIEGADGRTTLSVANLAARAELTSKIGTPEHRGSRTLPLDGDAFGAWETMSSYARDIEAEDFPYIAFGLPGSPVPTINSSSAIASLIHYCGLDPTQQLPYGIHLSPGMATLLGTGADDRMRIEHGFTTLLGGSGADSFEGSTARPQTEKFYGGSGDDVFRWSPGFNIVHGGQPQMDYASDGTDVIDYSGAGEVTITFNRHWIPHKVPNFIAVSDAGIDHLYSVERIQWNAKTDRIVLGKGIDLLEDNRVKQPVSSLNGGEMHAASLLDAGRASGERLVGNDADEVIVGDGGGDTLYGGAGDDTLAGGAGSDGYVYLPGDGMDVIIDNAGNTDVDELLLAGGIAPEDVGVFRAGDADLLLMLPGGGSVTVSGFFAASGAGIDRVVFDHAPAWTRAELAVRAVEALADYAHLHGGGADLFLAADQAVPAIWSGLQFEAHALGMF